MTPRLEPGPSTDRIRAGHVVEQGAKLTVAHRRAWRAGGGQRVVSGDAPATCICSHPTTGVGSYAPDLCRAGAIGHVSGAGIRAASPGFSSGMLS